MREEIVMEITKVRLEMPNRFVITLSGFGYGCAVAIDDIFKLIDLLQIRKHTYIEYNDIIGQLITVVFVDSIAKVLKSLISDKEYEL